MIVQRDEVIAGLRAKAMSDAAASAADTSTQHHHRPCDALLIHVWALDLARISHTAAHAREHLDEGNEDAG